MRTWQPVAFSVLITLALAAVWYFARPDAGRTNKGVELEDAGARQDGGEPLRLDPHGGANTSVKTDDPSHSQPVADQPALLPTEAAEVVAPVVDTPDYGPAICRGGAFVDFELYDPAGTRVPVQYYSVRLWRKVGAYWIREEVTSDTNTHVLRCLGLGEQDIPSTGLEPVAYQLELLSNSWGNFRHDFSVTRGETRTEKLTTPNTRIAVSLRFTQMDGVPISHLPDVPSVKAVSTPLDAIGREPAPTLELHNAPTEGGGRGGGMFWRTSRSGDPRPREWPEAPLYATDDGVMWAIVYAGAENTVTVKLNEELFGQAEYTLVDTFTSRANVEVRLACCADFETRLLAWGKPIEAFDPGYTEILDKPVIAKPKEAFDPYNAPVEPEYSRIVLELESPQPMQAQLSSDGLVVHTACLPCGDVQYANVYSGHDWWYRLTDNRFYVGPWEKLELASGQVQVLRRKVTDGVFRIDLGKLSPTLREFAHTADFDIAATLPAKPEPTEDPKTVEDGNEDPSDGPPPEPEPEPRFELPGGHERVSKFVMHRERGVMAFSSVAENEQIDRDITLGLSLRTHLRGAARWNRERNSSASRGRDGRFYWDPKVITGKWQSFDPGGQSLRGLLNAGLLQPEFKNVFVARAVGPQTEGLPWARGVILRHEDDAVAQQVRAIARRWESYLDIAPADPVGYAKSLAEAKDDAALKTLIGEPAFDAFETTEQRQWFARHGAWYDTGRKVYSDDQGYIAVENPDLKPGGYYVLYLWSNSRDEFSPDARFVFKVDDNGVADLGAIHLPTYTD